MNKKKKICLELLYLLFIFFACALIGGSLEILYGLIVRGNFNLGGFMYGPFRPIYGWGGLILYFTSLIFSKNSYF